METSFDLKFPITKIVQSSLRSSSSYPRWQEAEPDNSTYPGHCILDFSPEHMVAALIQPAQSRLHNVPQHAASFPCFGVSGAVTIPAVPGQWDSVSRTGVPQTYPSTSSCFQAGLS